MILIMCSVMCQNKEIVYNFSTILNLALLDALFTLCSSLDGLMTLLFTFLMIPSASCRLKASLTILSSTLWKVIIAHLHPCLNILW